MYVIMTDPQRHEENNEKAVEKLAWTIQASQGQFKLILARCNYASIYDTLIEKLHKICECDINVFYLKESEMDLYNIIREESNHEVQVLMILGLESLYNPPQFWTSANYMHKEFFNNFSFPLVLWINNDVYQQMKQLAPDLENWATTINFLSCLFPSS
ncbi:hypothetical protein A6V25_17605 [Nostoc sp. ATCC 53789]|nr:hypothetical protein A6V25_17605 [Nostoc sp. ATCC 53789]